MGMWKVIGFSVALCLALYFYKPILLSAKPIEKNQTDTIIDTVVVHKRIYIPQHIITVTGTKYQPTVAQCDSTPFNTADGSYIDSVKLSRGEIKWCALSQDLLWFNDGPFRYGDSIYVHSEQPAIKGWWIVHDCMNPRYKNRIDFLQWFDSDIHGQNPGLLISKQEI